MAKPRQFHAKCTQEHNSRMPRTRIEDTNAKSTCEANPVGQNSL